MFFNRFGIRKRLASAAFRTLRATGAFSLAANSARRNKSLLILCYHGLACNEEEKWRPDLYITPAQFRQRLGSLKRMDASVLGLDEGLTRLREGTLPPRSVVITFDDGFHDYLQSGVPALVEFGYPATLYLTTHYCDHRRPIFTLVLDYLLWRSDEKAVSFPEFGIESPMPLGSYARRQLVIGKIRDWMESKDMDTVAKDEAVQGLAERLRLDYSEIRRRKIVQVLDPEEVQIVAKSGTDVQLHTHRHRTPHDRALFTREILDNRKRIAELTGKIPVHFCYPSGVYSTEFFPWLAECGVKSATTCEKGFARADSEMMRLPRLLDDSGMDQLRFESAVAGLLI